jgi:hypothetical protein
VTIAILIGIALWDGLAPACATLEVDMLDVGTGINYVDVNTLAAVRRVVVLVERAK